jgi:hypothetical protein
VRNNNENFIGKTEQLIADISALLKGMDGAAQKPRKAEPSGETLKVLLEACKRLDIAGIDKALEELEAYSYDSGAELVEWLRNQANISGFTEIEERLGQG